MDGKVFGIQTSCNSCDYFLNGCMRRNLVDALIGNQIKTEAILGYDLSPRYHVEEIDWDGRSRLQLNRFGVAAMNVREVLEDAACDVAISPFIVEGQAVVAGIVTISRALIGNPSNALFRDPDTNGVIEQDYVGGYPKRVGINWEIKLQTTLTSVNVQHCKYMTVTIDAPDCDCDEGEIFAVYPGTQEVIPFARAPIVDETTGAITFLFYAWSLVDKEFREDDQIDLVTGDFYKLLTTVDFVCSKSVPALPIVTCNRDGCLDCSDDEPFSEDDNAVTVTAISNGMIDICWSNLSCNCSGGPVRIKVFYRTDPAVLNINLDNLEQAIVYLTASELSQKVCECYMPEYGFIWAAQQYYGDIKINQVTGMVSMQVKYGNMHGQVVYAQRLAGARIMKRLRII
ncbi:MAG: hypothetical protein ABI835_02045 [Chloroflexota bacterium]